MKTLILFILFILFSITISAQSDMLLLFSGGSVPDAPTSPAAVGATLDITVTWADPASNVDSIKVYRDSSGTDPVTLLATVAAGVQTYKDTGSVIKGGIYNYRLKAKNSIGLSDYTSTVSDTAFGIIYAVELGAPGGTTNTNNWIYLTDTVTGLDIDSTTNMTLFFFYKKKNLSPHIAYFVGESAGSNNSEPQIRINPINTELYMYAIDDDSTSAGFIYNIIPNDTLWHFVALVITDTSNAVRVKSYFDDGQDTVKAGDTKTTALGTIDINTIQLAKAGAGEYAMYFGQMQMKDVELNLAQLQTEYDRQKIGMDFTSSDAIMWYKWEGDATDELGTNDFTTAGAEVYYREIIDDSPLKQ